MRGGHIGRRSPGVWAVALRAFPAAILGGLDSTGGALVGASTRESGFLRPRGQDDVELLLASPDGLVEIYVGRARTTTSWELTSDVLARTPDAPDVSRAVRLYGIVDGALMYAIDRAGPDGPPRPWMSARLDRLR